MPNIRSQRVDDDGIHVVLSTGREITITPQMIRNRYLAETGTRDGRRTKVKTWLREQMSKTSGLAELLGEANIEIEFDEVTGRPTGLTVSQPGEEGR